MADEADTRNIYNGSFEEIAAILKLFAKKHGPSFFKYADENAKASQAKLIHGQNGVEGHVLVLGRLHALQANLSFKKTDILKALDHVAEAFNKDWKMSSDELADWRETMQRRIRNCCRCVHQGEVKAFANSSKSVPKWVSKLPWVLDTEVGGEGEGDGGAAGNAASSSGSGEPPQGKRRRVSFKMPEQPGEVPPDIYTYSYCEELQLPTRKLIKDGSAAIDVPGLPVDIDGPGDDDAEVVAEWPDGHRHALPGWTRKRLRLLQEHQCRKGSSSGDLWHIKHEATHHDLIVKQKVDRNLLMCGYEQKKMIISLKMNIFAKIDDERSQVPASHPATVGALDFVKGILTKYSKGEIQKADINSYKVAALKELGLGGRPSALRKRPAASVSKAAVKKEVKDEAKVSPVKDEQPEPKVRAGGAGTSAGGIEECTEGEEQDRLEEGEEEEPCSPDECESEAAATGNGNVTTVPSDWAMPSPPQTMLEKLEKFFG
jgi:hypothetical protein